MTEPRRKPPVRLTVERLETRQAPSVTPAPTVAFVTPAAVAILRGVAAVQVQAGDNVGVSRVEFYVDGSLRATDTQAPYTFNFDTTAAGNGSHVLKAIAYDATGNSASAGVPVIVLNLGSPPPSP